MNDNFASQLQCPFEKRALKAIVNRHGLDIYAHVTLNELREMIEEEAIRLQRQTASLEAAA